MKRRNTRNHRRYRPAAFARNQRRLQQKGSGHGSRPLADVLTVSGTPSTSSPRSMGTPASPLQPGYPANFWFGQKKRRARTRAWTGGKKERARRLPTLPRKDRSTIGVEGLDFRVRDGNGYGPLAVAAGPAHDWKHPPVRPPCALPQREGTMMWPSLTAD